MTTPDIHVRCPHCRGLSAVPPEVIGRPVACPFCEAVFAAVPDVGVTVPRPVKTRDIPIVYVAKKPVAEVDEEPHAEGPDRTMAIGAALLPLGIPLMWAVLAASGKWEPLFTPGVPIGLGVGATLLALGAALTRDWSASGRVKAVFAVVLLGYGVGAGLFVLKKEWAEAVRKRFGRDEFGWQVYNPGIFQVKFPPGRVRPDPDPLLPDWKMLAVRLADPKPTGDRFRAAHGQQPDDLAPLENPAWFDAVRKRLTTDDTGEATRTTDLFHQGFVGREFAFTRSDGATNLTVRVYRIGEGVILLAAEGPLLPADGKDVTTFFRSLFIDPKLK